MTRVTFKVTHLLQAFSSGIFCIYVQDFNWHSASRDPSAIAELQYAYLKAQLIREKLRKIGVKVKDQQHLCVIYRILMI